MERESMFRWKNRMGCIRYVQVLVACKQLDLDAAIKCGLHYVRMQESDYAFCQQPDQIPGIQLEYLKRDAAAYIIQQRERGKSAGAVPQPAG